nr:RNA polymerase sigma factor [Thermomonospora umbrina]
MTAPADTDPVASPEPPGRITDAGLVEESWAVPERFAALFDRHSDEIHRYAARRVGPEAAEDVVGETFLTAFRKRRTYDVARPDARPWLYGIANLAVRQQRRAEARWLEAGARTPARDTAEAFDERSADRVTAEHLQPRLAEVLAGLSSADRDLLLLVAWADLTYEEAAQALAVPIGTVRSRLHRIRHKVRRAFGGTDPMAPREEPLT